MMLLVAVTQICDELEHLTTVGDHLVNSVDTQKICKYIGALNICSITQHIHKSVKNINEGEKGNKLTCYF